MDCLVSRIVGIPTLGIDHAQADELPGHLVVTQLLNVGHPTRSNPCPRAHGVEIKLKICGHVRRLVA